MWQCFMSNLLATENPEIGMFIPAYKEAESVGGRIDTEGTERKGPLNKYRDEQTKRQGDGTRYSKTICRCHPPDTTWNKVKSPKAD